VYRIRKIKHVGWSSFAAHADSKIFIAIKKDASIIENCGFDGFEAATA
jgi:hypothetical protein